MPGAVAKCEAQVSGESKCGNFQVLYRDANYKGSVTPWVCTFCWQNVGLLGHSLAKIVGLCCQASDCSRMSVLRHGPLLRCGRIRFQLQTNSPSGRLFSKNNVTEIVCVRFRKPFKLAAEIAAPWAVPGAILVIPLRLYAMLCTFTLLCSDVFLLPCSTYLQNLRPSKNHQKQIQEASSRRAAQ